APEMPIARIVDVLIGGHHTARAAGDRRDSVVPIITDVWAPRSVDNIEATAGKILVFISDASADVRDLGTSRRSDRSLGQSRHWRGTTDCEDHHRHPFQRHDSAPGSAWDVLA